MKHSLLRSFLLLGALTAGLSSASATLVAHWPLDTDASDATGNGHDGAVVGGTVTFGQAGANANTGSAASFPDNGHIDVPYDAALNPGVQGPDGSGSFTVALWVFSTSNAGYNSPFTAREDNGSNVNGPIIYNDPNGNWSFWAGNNGPPGAWNPVNDGPVALNVWQHVAISYDAATTTRRMFVDGVEVINQVGGMSANAQRDIHIGSGQDNGLNFFWNGLIDDVGLWDTALSEAEILSVMDNGITSGEADPNLEVGNLIEFDYDGTGDFNIELTNSGASQNLNIIGTPVVGGPDAANFSVVTVPDPIAPGGTGNIACSFNPLGGNGMFEATYEIESDDSLVPNATVTVRVTVHDPFAAGPALIDFGTLPAGSGPQVLPITLENRGTNQLLVTDLSFEGANATNFSVGPFSNINGGASIEVELTLDPAGADGTFVAELVITSNDPITPVLNIPILARVEVANPLVACWTLDDDATDTSGNGFDGVIVGTGITFGQAGANDATGSSASFDGQGHIDVPWDPALNTQDFTVTLWANAAAAGGGSFRSPITNRDDVAPGGAFRHGWIIYNNNAGQWSFWNGGGTAANGAWNVANVGPVVIDEWHHLAISYDSATNTKQFFIDGTSVSTTNPVNLSPNNSASAFADPTWTYEDEDLHIGGGGDDGASFRWTGGIDDIGLFRVALAEEDVADIMTKGVSGFKNRSRFFFDVEDIGGGMLTLRWASKGGKLYNLRSALGLDTEPADWLIFDGNQDLAADPPENSLTIPRPADPGRFFVIEEFPAPPQRVFFDDFESGGAGWTVDSEGAPGTDWELGMPSDPGPATANSPDNCYGTNLATNYAIDANAWLQSPSINLTNAGGATLSYFQVIDAEGAPFDFGTVSVIDADNGSVLAVLESDIGGFPGPWEQVVKKLPAAALGKNVKFEFRFQSDGDFNFSGWYIDDVEVTVP